MFDVAEDITFDHAPSPQYPALFSDAIIECIVSGQPVPELSYRYEGVQIQTGNEMYLILVVTLKCSNCCLMP